MRLHQPSQHLSPQERTAIVPLALYVPLFLGHDQRQRGHQVSNLAEASNSHALKGLVCGGRTSSDSGASRTGCTLPSSLLMGFQGNVRHFGPASKASRQPAGLLRPLCGLSSTPGAVLRKYNPVHCAVHVCSALVDSAGSFPRCIVALGQSYCGEVANVLAAAHLL